MPRYLADHEPFDLVLAFSQGGTALAIYMARQVAMRSGSGFGPKQWISLGFKAFWSHPPTFEAPKRPSEHLQGSARHLFRGAWASLCAAQCRALNVFEDKKRSRCLNEADLLAKLYASGPYVDLWVATRHESRGLMTRSTSWRRCCLCPACARGLKGLKEVP